MLGNYIRLSNLSAESLIDGKQVVVLTAAVSSKTDVATQYTEFVANPALYYANLTEVRADIEEFRNKMYKLEDETKAEAVASPEPESEPVE